MKRTKEEADTTKASIIDAALKVFCRRGYAATSLEEIAAEAGVTRGAVYHHFDGKVGLYDAVIEAKTMGARALMDGIDPAASVPHSLKALLARALALLEEDAEYRMVQDLVLFKTAYAEELERGMERKREAMAGLEKAIADMLKRGIDRGEIRADLKPRAAAIALVGLLNGVAVSWLLDPARFSIKAMAASIADSVIKGMTA